MFNLAKKALFRTLILIIPFITTTAHGYSYTSYSSPTGAWGWTGSYEIMKFTRDTITLDDVDGTLIPPITLDITENPGFDGPTTQSDGTIKYSGMGDALIKGVIKVEHGPELGTAYVEVQMRYKIDIEIIQTPVFVEDGDGGYTFYKENRVYQTVLSDTLSNADLLNDGFKKVIPEYGVTGVYIACDDTHPEYDTYKDFAYLCESDVGFGTGIFNPVEIFKTTITSASGEPIGPEVGFHYLEVCLAFPPEKLGVTSTNPDFDQKVDNDDYLNDNLFRSCEGRSIVLKACIPDPAPTNTEFKCTDLNGDDNPFTIVLADGIAGDRVLPPPATTCIEANVEDWFKLDSDEYKGIDLVITPCDPYQGYMLLPYRFSDSTIEFTNSEGDGQTIDGLQITSITTFSQLGTALYLEESADKTNSIYDFSNINLNVSYINGLELVDTITGSPGSDVILGGNGGDKLYGFSGDDCIDGQQNNDHMWGDSHFNNHDTDPDNDREVSNGRDAFVLTSKLGKDTIYDYSHADGDVLMNASNTSTPTMEELSPGVWKVSLKGQNFVTVHVIDGGGAKPIIENDLTTGVCANHPLNN